MTRSNMWMKNVLTRVVRSRAGVILWRLERHLSTVSDSSVDAADVASGKPSSSHVNAGNSGSSDINYRPFEDQLFESLAEGHQRSTVELSRLLREIKNAGLRRNDPRLSESMAKIGSLTVDMPESGEVELTREMLRDIVQENSVLIRRAVVGDFVIPDFPKFCGAIDEIYWACRSNASGRVSSYMPQLSRQEPNQWGVAVCTVDGQRHANGDFEVPFTIQSGGRPINYALAVNELGEDTVHQFVGHEPSEEEQGPAHVRLDRDGKPPNPMINAGALVISSLLRTGRSLDERFEAVMSEYRRLTGDGYVSFNSSVFLEENEIADHNYAIGYFLRQNKCFPAGVNLHETLDLYFQLCSTELTADSGAVMAATLANGGFCPTTGEQVLSAVSVRNTLSLMHSCGMYNYSGGFAFKVGLPSKSAISGAILLVVPNVLGMCLWSPSLDEMGNSVRGIQFCERLVRTFNFHHYDSAGRNKIGGETVSRSGVEKSDSQVLVRSELHSGSVVRLLFTAQNADLNGLRGYALSGHDMSAADYDGRTALHVAAAEGHLNCIRFLIEKCRVPPSARDRWGQSPLDEARLFERSNVVAYLEGIVGKEGESDGSSNPHTALGAV